MKRVMMLVAAVGSLMMASPSLAELETFASFLPTDSGRDMHFTANANGPGGTLSSANEATNFTWLLSDYFGAAISTESATFKFTAVSTDYAIWQINLPGTSKQYTEFDQGGFDGSFSFTYTGPTIVLNGITHVAGENLLTGVFTNAYLSGKVGRTSGSIDESDAGRDPLSTALYVPEITYTSDFVTFTPDTARDFSLALTAVTPKFALTGPDNLHGDLASFAATATGAFSADPLPIVNSAAPETATWSMLLIGFGMMGGTVRARRASQRKLAHA